jgi:hypothetical protein
MTLPYPWEPSIVDIQILRIGQLVVLAVPGEFTTMAGRRLRKAVKNVFTSHGAIPAESIEVVIAGLSNSYSGYVATFEEYQVQRYEGASTIYGPYTLDAYIQEFTRLALGMVNPDCQSKPCPDADQLPRTTHPATVGPVDFTNRLITFLPPVVFDSVPLGRRFGQVVPGYDVQSVYNIGETVKATFYAGHPRNNDPTDQLTTPFLRVQKYVGPDRVALKEFLLQRDLCTGPTVVQILPRDDNVSLEIRLTTNPSLRFQSSSDSFTLQSRTLHWTSTSSKLLKPGMKVKEKKEIWKTVRDENDWDTEFRWHKPIAGIASISYAQLEWTVSKHPGDVELVASMHKTKLKDDGVVGVYRLVYTGANKSPVGKVRTHVGYSSPFRVATQYGLRSEDGYVDTFEIFC